MWARPMIGAMWCSQCDSKPDVAQHDHLVVAVGLLEGPRAAARPGRSRSRRRIPRRRATTRRGVSISPSRSGIVAGPAQQGAHRGLGFGAARARPRARHWSGGSRQAASGWSRCGSSGLGGWARPVGRLTAGAAGRIADGSIRRARNSRRYSLAAAPAAAQGGMQPKVVSPPRLSPGRPAGRSPPPRPVPRTARHARRRAAGGGAATRPAGRGRGRARRSPGPAGSSRPRRPR